MNWKTIEEHGEPKLKMSTNIDGQLVQEASIDLIVSDGEELIEYLKQKLKENQENE